MVREPLGSYEILHEGTVIARHQFVDRHQVVLKLAYYAGLLRLRGSTRRWPGRCGMNPGYPAAADVTVCDLGVYAVIAEEGGPMMTSHLALQLERLSAPASACVCTVWRPS